MSSGIDAYNGDPELAAIVEKLAAKKLERKKQLAKKHKDDDEFVQCSAGVKMTKKAAKAAIDEADPDSIPLMYVMTYIDGEKERTDSFKQCSAGCKDSNEFCSRHQKKFDDDPLKIIDFRSPDDYAGYKLISIEDSFFDTKPRAKRTTKPSIKKEQVDQVTKFLRLIQSDPVLFKRYQDCEKRDASEASDTSSDASGDEEEETLSPTAAPVTAEGDE